LSLLFAAINQTLIATNMKKVLVSLSVLSLAIATNAQVLLSGGLTYSQNFDTLASALVGTATTSPWTDNSTLVGWYASRGLPTPTTAWTSMRLDPGDNTSGQIHDYGATASTDRSLGSLGSGTPGTNAIGLRILNDTGAAFTGDITISYTGEQWRNGGNTAVQTILTFGYATSASPFTSPISASSTDGAFTPLASLNFNSPTVGATAAALDGNAAANQVALSGTILGITLNAGDEILLRWYDINDTGNDHGGGLDNLTVTFATVPEPTVAVLGGLGLLGMAFWRRRK
jgi:hypothetical protein